MGLLDGVGLRFKETMSGYLAMGVDDPDRGAERGKREGSTISFTVDIEIDDLGRFIDSSTHEARLSGTVTCNCGRLNGTFSIPDGTFNLFSIDPETGWREMHYAFAFRDPEGQTYFLDGRKKIHDDPGQFDVIGDMTTLFTTVHRGENHRGPILGAGKLLFDLRDVVSLVGSMEVTGQPSVRQRLAAYTAFMSFAYGAMRDEYLDPILITYDTEYENLVLSGQIQLEDAERPFFLVSGVHAKGFPWGDGETFSDVLFVVSDGMGGYDRYCITDRRLEGLEVDVEHGRYRYRGPLFLLKHGYKTSFSAMREATAEDLIECEADLQVDFTARAFERVPFPFPKMAKLIGKLLPSTLVEELEASFPSEHPLGIHIGPHAVTVTSGRFSIRPPATARPLEMRLHTDKTFGEAERSTIRNFKEPTLLYGYICAVRSAARAARVQIHARTMRDEKERWLKDLLDKFLGAVVSRIASGEFAIEGDHLQVRRLDRKEGAAYYDRLLRKLGDPVLEVNNDHFPTAVFQRRIILVLDPSGAECLALEEDMEQMRLEPINSDRTVTVACIVDEDKFAALDRVLEETGLRASLDEHRRESGKDKADFSIVIKPNFMFAYNKRDRSTYTDPELVRHLATWLRREGYQKLAVVEAQSTYGEYFDKRSVPEVADYLGFDRQAFDIVDLTEEATGRHHLGPHLPDTPISPTWRDADFRISFAKNKTHAYAYYTLTLKNIYGALPLANKFKEYHCERDIYHTTIEYLTQFPVHFGLIDAFLSADGPFGIFADTAPNPTRTIVGGADLVAVDWVAASKMGIDPRVSEYMRLALEEFGKPRIVLVGDASPYRPWLNAPMLLTLFVHNVLDQNYHFGNMFYMACSQMDETHFRAKHNAWWRRALRRATLPLRRALFLRTNELPSWSNRLANRFFYWLGY